MAKKIDVAESITPSVEVPHVSKHIKEIAAEKLQSLMQEEGRLVKGLFQNFENPGCTQKITYKKYPTAAEMRKRGQPGGLEPFAKSMTDGQEYEIPLYVARFLNGTDVSADCLNEGKKSKYIGTCSYPVHGFKSVNDQLAPGYDSMIPGVGAATIVPIVGVVNTKKRFGFQSLEFAGAVA
jgi:hypothetical protein